MQRLRCLPPAVRGGRHYEIRERQVKPGPAAARSHAKPEGVESLRELDFRMRWEGEMRQLRPSLFHDNRLHILINARGDG
jgi:hypothetical protein